MKLLGTLRRIDETKGAVRVEDVYDTDIEDLSDACTNPERLARWIATVPGDLRQGDEFDASFTSGFEGRCRIEMCEPPNRLLVTTWDSDTGDASTMEARLEESAGGTRLVIEESGVPVGQLAGYGAGCRCTLRTWPNTSPARTATRTRPAGATWSPATAKSTLLEATTRLRRSRHLPQADRSSVHVPPAAIDCNAVVVRTPFRSAGMR